MQQEEMIEAKNKISPTDLEQWLGNWIWRTTHCLIDHPEFDPSPKWLSKRLGIKLGEAVNALEGLERLNLIERVGKTFRATSNWHQTGPNELEHSRLHRAHMLVTNTLLNKLTASDKYSSQFFLANQEIIKKYAPKFSELFKQMNDEGLAVKATEVYGTQITFSKLTTHTTQSGEI